MKMLLIKSYLPLFATFFPCQIESPQDKIWFPKTFRDAYCPKKFWAAPLKILCRIDLHLLKTDALRSSTLTVKNRRPNCGEKGGVKTFVNKKWLVSRTVMIRCALESPYLRQPFKYLGYYHITHRKYFRATWSWKMPQKRTKTQKFRGSQLALKNKIWSFARFL